VCGDFPQEEGKKRPGKLSFKKQTCARKGVFKTGWYLLFLPRHEGRWDPKTESRKFNAANEP